MSAPANNRYWTTRHRHGRKLRFASPEVLWETCCEYFEWVVANPLKEEKPFVCQGKVVKVTIEKMRPMTLTGLQRFIGLSHDAWSDYRKRQDFGVVCERVEGIIFEQKFTGAAIGVFNPVIIARDLGLNSKKRRGVTGSVAAIIAGLNEPEPNSAVNI